MESTVVWFRSWPVVGPDGDEDGWTNECIGVAHNATQLAAVMGLGPDEAAALWGQVARDKDVPFNSDPEDGYTTSLVEWDGPPPAVGDTW